MDIKNVTMEAAVDVVSNAADMFGGTATMSIEGQVESLSVFIATEDDELERLQKSINDRKAQLDQAKTQLAELMMQAGIEKLSLSNGLTPKAVTKTKYFKAAGVDDSQMFDWLRENGIGDIIRDYVHFQTLQGTLSNFVGEIPTSIFNVTTVPTITMYGKSKFLAGRGE